MNIDRRDFIKLAGVCTAVLVSGQESLVFGAGDKMKNDFMFLQLSDTHWGFNNPKNNPDYAGTLKKAIKAINNTQLHPDFIMFTGDLTHTTEDPQRRRKLLSEFKDIVKELKIKDIKFMPGEHDAGLDNAQAYKEAFGETHYTFRHKDLNFIVLDNVSDPASSIGDEQLKWLGAQLKKIKHDSRVIVFTHRPLFDLYPQWDWFTRDGSKAIDLLMPFKNVTVFYGHIHQENYHMTGHIAHHAAKGLMYPLPAPGSVPKKAPVEWDPASPYKGLGYRSIEMGIKTASVKLTEYPVMEMQT
ncbi:MAG TPA: metallophosphoesterase [Smithella sp.]|nr:metallophosphoesterase [Smithella sp.]